MLKKLSKLNRKRLYWQRELRWQWELLFLPKRNKPIDYKEVQSIVFPVFLYAGIGDAVFLSGLFHILSKHGFSIYVIANSSNKFIFENMQAVTKVFIQDKHTGVCDELKNQNFDLAVDLFSRFQGGTCQYLSLYRKLDARYLVAFKPRTNSPFNQVFTVSSATEHVTKTLQQILSILELPVVDLMYQISVPKQYLEDAIAYLHQFKNKKIIFLNPWASVNGRSLSNTQLTLFIEYMNLHEDIVVIISGEKFKLNSIKPCGNCVLSPFESFWHAAALTSLSDLVISVDTSIVHIACAFNKDLIAIYSSEILTGLVGNYFYAPKSDRAIQLIAPDCAAKNMDIKIVYELALEVLAGKYEFGK